MYVNLRVLAQRVLIKYLPNGAAVLGPRLRLKAATAIAAQRRRNGANGGISVSIAREVFFSSRQRKSGEPLELIKKSRNARAPRF